MKSSRIHTTRGFSIVELMVALLLASFMLLAAATLLVQSHRENKLTEESRSLQASGRVAIRRLSHAISLTGYWGGIVDKHLIGLETLSITNDCGAAGTWAFNPLSPDLGFHNDIGAELADDRCFSANEVLAGTDVVSARHVNDTEVSALSENGTYLKANTVAGTLFQGDEQPTVPAGTTKNWQLAINIFYIKSPGAGEPPSLCTKSLSASSKAMIENCLVAGVEDLQLEFGIDSTGNQSINYYTANPTSIELSQAMNARLYLLLRNDRQLFAYSNRKSYKLGSKTIAAKNDGYLREVFSSTIPLRNHGNAKVRTVKI